MNLEDKLKELKEEVPKVDSSLESKIYLNSIKKKTGRNPFFNKLTLSIAGIVSIILILTIGLVTFRQVENNKMNSAVHLLKQVIEPKDKENPSDSYAEFCDTVNIFSGELASLAVEELGSSENTVMSPVSLFSALALAVECSDGASRQQILDAMGMDYATLALNYEKLYQEINRVGFYADDPSKTKCKLTNSIWLDKNAVFKETGLNNLANHYYSYSHSLDMKKIDYVNRYIKAFISKQTDGFLKPDFSISKDTIFLLMNTLYLKDVWQSTGKEIKLTDAKYDFTNADGSKITKKLMMGKYILGKAYEQEEYREFYTSTSSGYKVHFIVPKEEYDIDQIFTSEVISALCKREYEKENEEAKERYFTRVLFPEFQAESSLHLEEILTKLGISDIFHIETSDFSNLSDGKLVCNGVSQSAKLVVNRKGIEGGAVTFFEGAGAPGPSEVKEIYYDFVVDRSFGYVITNSKGINLFSGIIRHI
ncbi:MAG: hypothetical protein K2I88_04240 [Anaeroplasmataceae bacterium]|nr:hypothetical protein [Anaeroplasmataceae bacterium]